MCSGELQCGPDLARVEFGLGGQDFDPVFLAPLQLTESRHDFPHVGASRQGGSPGVAWTAVDDPGMIQDVYPLNDETFEQGGGAYRLALGTIGEAAFGLLAETK